MSDRRKNNPFNKYPHYHRQGFNSTSGMTFLCAFLFADFQEPYAVVVLLEKDLVVIDLAQNG